jgi:hypothetical protein
MKRWHKIVLTAVLILAAIVGLRYAWLGHEEKQRELVYLSIADSYARTLKPGTTRQAVHNYLLNRGVQLRKDERNSQADITKIGSENPPWYCNEEDVFISFRYTGEILQSIIVEKRLETYL